MKGKVSQLFYKDFLRREKGEEMMKNYEKQQPIGFLNKKTF